jgi:Tfp pilus assembly protein PilP
MVPVLALVAVAAAGPGRDPFAPLVPDAPRGPEAVGTQAFPAADFRVVGVLEDGPEAHALLIDPNGRSWVVGERDYVGDAWGIVRDVNEHGVGIVEEWSTVGGDIRERVITLSLGGAVRVQ